MTVKVSLMTTLKLLGFPCHYRRDIRDNHFLSWPALVWEKEDGKDSRILTWTDTRTGSKKEKDTGYAGVRGMVCSLVDMSEEYGSAAARRKVQKTHIKLKH